MSGIEVAGLVLGALPLIISALEHYRETAEVAEDWWKFKRKYQKCKRDLEYLQLGFSANLEELLLPLVCDDDEITDLMANPGGPAWQNEQLEGKLQERLSTAYDLYVHSMVDLKAVMTKLTRELGLENMAANIHRGESLSEASLIESTKSVYAQFTQRTKFALGQSTREKLFEEFTKYNDRLRDLLRTSDHLEKVKTTRKSKDKSMAKLTSVIWKRAATLYRLLYDAWECSCKDSHQANLRLQDRSTEDSVSSFDIKFLYSALSDSSEKPWKCCNTSIVVVDRPCSMVPSLRSPSPMSPSLPSLSRSSTAVSTKSEGGKSSFFKKVKIKRATFADEGTMSLSRMTTIVSSEISLPLTAKSEASEATLVEDEKQHEIDSLCETLKATENTDIKACCGVLKEGGEHYQIFPQSGQTQVSSDGTFSLKDLLEKTTKIRLTRRQRYSLASTLASSQAQLHATPWLSQSWSTTEILFFKEDTESKSNPTDLPRLSTSFNKAADQSMSTATSDRDLKSLGILLLELCFGSTLEKTEIRQKYPVLPGIQNTYLDLAAAHELCEHVSEEAGPEYSAAVEWCLKKNQSGSNTDTEWRTEIYENVVKPLQQCHGHLTG